MHKGLKQAFLRASKRAGLFRLARLLTRGELRILCYHGVAMRDEAAFRPQLFIDPRVFERRLEWLAESGFTVLSLDEALERRRSRTLPPNPVVITIDDGFFGTFRHAIPALARRGMPATVYVTTYYALKGTPVFRLLAQYCWWATRRRTLKLESLEIPELRGTGALADDRETDPLLWQIIDYGETRLQEPQRQALAWRLAAALDVDIQAVQSERLLGLMSPEEIGDAAAAGIDVQLHTHRHRFPANELLAIREVSQNRSVLEPLVRKPLRHLCYPSGEWHARHFTWLTQLQVLSATTCEVGFVRADAHPLALARVFDGSHVTEIEFEAELNGYLEVLRRVRHYARALDQKVRGRGGASKLPVVPASTGALSTGEEGLRLREAARPSQEALPSVSSAAAAT